MTLRLENYPPALFSTHAATFQRFMDAVITYDGSVPPPEGFVLPAVVDQETLMLAVLEAALQSEAYNIVA